MRESERASEEDKQLIRQTYEGQLQRLSNYFVALQGMTGLQLDAGLQERLRAVEAAPTGGVVRTGGAAGGVGVGSKRDGDRDAQNASQVKSSHRSSTGQRRSDVGQSSCVPKEMEEESREARRATGSGGGRATKSDLNARKSDFE